MHRILATILTMMAGFSASAADPAPLKVLFLGDRGHHVPAERFAILRPVFASRGIDLTYTEKAGDLNPDTLKKYDALIVYANNERITPGQEKALIDYVEGGGGFVPLHCASFCFLNSPAYIDLVGAQFKSHGTGVFTATSAKPDHPILAGYRGFESWDETYVHTKHNDKNRTVIEVRVDGDKREPWTWVRTQGKGRVFYTAWGHDERTWGDPGFQELVERGLRWAVGQDPTRVTRPAGKLKTAFDRPFAVPEMTPKRTDVKPFTFDDVGKKIPNYTASKQWGVQGEPLNMMQTPLTPAESQKHVVVPTGFRAELFVTEDELGGKPVCMAWDEKGRLWAALTVDYPNELKPPQQGRDSIVCCEDTDGDGRGDKVTVFADKLSVPTSLLFSNGGVIAFSATQTLFLKDDDGDGKADTRTVLFGTWNMRDTHGGPSNMQYGLDNWVYAMQGYNDSQLTVGGEDHRFRQGFFRFKPDASALEFLRSTNNNTWGLGISEEGIIFGSTANGNPSEFLPIPNRYYEAVRGWTPSLVLGGIADSNRFLPITEKVRQVDHHGGYTAAAGHSLYTARTYPDAYWNRTAFVAEPTGHLVATFVIRSDGSGFKSSNPFNLFASDDEWTAPIMAEVGPDGNVWVLDWYNYIVQHNPTPQGFRTGKGAAYETDLRDKTKGRIYRVVHESTGKPTGTDAALSLADASPAELVAALTRDNLFWRRHAQRMLVERGNSDVAPALIALTRDQTVDPIGLNVGVIHALWTLHGLGQLDGSNPDATNAAVAALKHPAPGVRRNAVQVLPRTVNSVAAVLDAGLTDDPNMQVRLLAVLALADLPPTPAAGKAIADVLARPENARDRWLPEAATVAAANNDAFFLRAVGSAPPSPKTATVAAAVAEHLARGEPTDVTGVLTGLTTADPVIVDAVLRGLAAGWPTDRTFPLDDETEAAIAALGEALPLERRAVLARLAVRWGSRHAAKLGMAISDALTAVVDNPNVGIAERLAAARELVGYRPDDEAVAKRLLALVNPQAPPTLSAGILNAVRVSRAAGVDRLVLDQMANMTPAARTAAVSVLLTRPDWTRTLISGIDAGTVRLTELALDQQQALAAHPDEAVRTAAVAALNRGGAMPNADRQKLIVDWSAVATSQGNATAGKAVFTAQCAKCHKHSGEGQQIGPDLTGMAAHPKAELLVHILDPSRSVEGNFRVYTVTTLDGLVLQGVLASESRTAVELIDAEGKTHAIPRDDIDVLRGSTKSLMPEGFEKQIDKRQLTDLLEFLTQKGRYLPLPLDKIATVTSAEGMFYDRAAPAERLVLPDWKPRTVAGVPFVLTDPRDGRTKNFVMLHGPVGTIPPTMPGQVSLPCNAPAKAVHILGCVSGWGFPYSREKSTSMIVRLHYVGGESEDHPLVNGVHLADYIRKVDVPGSKHAFAFPNGQQARVTAVMPTKPDVIERIELIKGKDQTAPIVMAVTIETPTIGPVDQ